MITHVNAVRLDSWADVVDVLEAANSENYWEITVRRKAGSPATWQTLTYEIWLAVSIAPLEQARGDVRDFMRPPTAETTAPAGCGCSATQGICGWAAMIGLILLPLMRRRRRRARR